MISVGSKVSLLMKLARLESDYDFIERQSKIAVSTANRGQACQKNSAVTLFDACLYQLLRLGSLLVELHDSAKRDLLIS